MSTTALSGSNIGGNGAKLGAVAEEIPRYGLAVVLAYLGLMKFTSYEANAIVGLVENSPLLSWTYSIFSARALSGLIGTVELGIASLLFIGGRFPKVRLVGSAAAVGTFALTLTFLLSTPGVFEPTLGGFPALVRDAGTVLDQGHRPIRGRTWDLRPCPSGMAARSRRVEVGPKG